MKKLLNILLWICGIYLIIGMILAAIIIVINWGSIGNPFASFLRLTVAWPILIYFFYGLMNWKD